MSYRKPCARNVLWKQLETICSSAFEFPEKTEMLALAPLYIHVPMYLGAYYKNK